MTDNIATRKTDEAKWTPVWLLTVVDKAAVTRRWSTQAVTWSGNSYLAVVEKLNAPTLEAGGVYGIDAVPEISFVLNNSDASLNSVVTPANIQGAVITLNFVFVNPATGGTTTDSLCLGSFVADLPQSHWPKVQITAQNRMNLARRSLPISVITRRDRYPFPETSADRAAAYNDPTSPFYALGYSPENGHGNYKTGTTPYTPDEYNGTRDVDTGDGTVSLETIGLSARFGGFGQAPPTITYYPKKGEHDEFVGSANEAKIGGAVPLVYGRCRIQPIVLAYGALNTNGEGMGHYLLCDGVNFAPADDSYGISACRRVWLVGVNGKKNWEVYGYAFYGGYLGSQYANDHCYRNITPGTDFPATDNQDRDLYSGLAYIGLAVPREFSAPSSGVGPTVEALIDGLRIETWATGPTFTATWEWSDNPIWIMVDLLKRLGIPKTSMDQQSVHDAADYCDETLANGLKRFRCNLALMAQVKAADVIRGIRNNCRLYFSYGADGKLNFKIEKDFTTEGSSFTFDSTNIARDGSGARMVRVFHKSILETANSFSLNFQDEANSYVSDSLTVLHVDNINQIGQRISGDSITAILGIPSFDQAERQLNWIKAQAIDANEFYAIRATAYAIDLQVGQVGTITDTPHGLSAQQCRIRSITPNANGTVDLILQKHVDSAYSDTSNPSPLVRARSDTTYSPRSVGAISGAVGAPTLEEDYILDDKTPDVYHRIMTASFSVPSHTVDTTLSRHTIAENATVTTTDGSLAGNQVLYVEIAPVVSGVEGYPSDTLQVNIPAGTNTNKFTLDVTLPAEATHYRIRIGSKPGKTYLHSTTASPGTTKFTTSAITSIASLDSSSLAPDPKFDHVRAFYRYDVNTAWKDGGRTAGPTDASITFTPEPPGTTDTEITVKIVSANAAETDFYPFDDAPSAALEIDKDPLGSPGVTPDTVVPDAPTVNVANQGRLVALVGVEKPAGTPAGWNNVTRLTLQVAYDAAFSEKVYWTAPDPIYSGAQIQSHQFSVPTSRAGKVYVRAKATNAIGDSSWSATSEGSTTVDVREDPGDTGVPSAPTITLYNSGDVAGVAKRNIRVRVNFSGCTGINTIWQVAVQLHTSATMTNPEASPIFTPGGDGVGAWVMGSNVFQDGDATFPIDGSINNKWLLCSRTTPWPGSPASDVMVVWIKEATDTHHLALPGNGASFFNSGSYTYRICSRQDELDSGAACFDFKPVYGDAARQQGYADVEFSVPPGVNYYARAWIYNSYGRSPASSVSSAKQGVKPDGAELLALSVPGGALAAGAISDLAKFASGLTAIEYLSSLPSTNNFIGRTVILTTGADLGKVQRCVALPNTWSKSTDGADIIANTITATQLAATAINGMTITGSIVRTDAGANRTELNGTSFVSYSGGNSALEIAQGILYAYTIQTYPNQILTILGGSTGINISSTYVELRYSGSVQMKVEVGGPNFPSGLAVAGTVTINSSRQWTGAVISSSYIGSHNHAGSDINSGTIDNARLPSSISVSGDIHSTSGIVHGAYLEHTSGIYGPSSYCLIDGSHIHYGTHYYCDGSAGFEGTFTEHSGKTVTVKGGIITSVA